MASETDIANLALSHIGQDANLSALTEQSADAQHCQRFYAMARNELLESFDWSFARKRVVLTEKTNDREDWGYAFALPSDMLLARRLLPDGYGDTEDELIDFEREGDTIYCDDPAPTLVYTRLLTDTTKFSATFVIALSWRLSSYVAGPIIKDPTGKTATRLRQVSDIEAGIAKAADANAERKRATYTPTAGKVR